MTATTLPQTAEAYSELVARYAQYEREVGRMRPVRMAFTVETKAGLHALPGDEMLGYYEPSILPGYGHYVVFSPRTGWHFMTAYGVEFMDGDTRE